MELLFTLLLLCAICGVVFSAIEGDTWWPAIISGVLAVALGLGFMYYVNLGPQVTEVRRLTTDCLKLGGGSNIDYVVFPQPTPIKVTLSKKWGSLNSETTYVVGGD